MAEQPSPVKEIHCESAKEFLQTLDPTNDLWRNVGQNWWIYRGVKKASFELLPAAWRDENCSVSGSLLVSTYLSRWFDQETTTVAEKKRNRRRRLFEAVAFEIEAARLFHDRANGLRFDVQWEWSFDSARTYWFSQKRTPNAMYPRPTRLVAMMQHHGIPTRLLDWSRNPLVAAYFAARDPHEYQSDDLAVWALAAHKLKNFALTKTLERHNSEPNGRGLKNLDLPEIKLLNVPRKGFEFLHAQEGLFTYLHNAIDVADKKGHWPTMDEFIADEINEYNRLREEHRIHPSFLLKVTLSRSEAQKLLGLLGMHGITHEKLHPTLDNVGASVMRLCKETRSDARSQDEGQMNGLSL